MRRGPLREAPLLPAQLLGKGPSPGIASLSCLCTGRLSLGEKRQGSLGGGQRRIQAWVGGQDSLPAPHQLATGPWEGEGSLPNSRTQFPLTSLEGFGLWRLRSLPAPRACLVYCSRALDRPGFKSSLCPSLSEHHFPGRESRIVAMSALTDATRIH